MTMKYSTEDEEDTGTESPEAKALAEEAAREMNAWKQNQVTVHVRIGLEEQANVAFRNLVAAGLQTTDPTVARYASQYDALTKLIKNMKVMPDGA